MTDIIFSIISSILFLIVLYLSESILLAAATFMLCLVFGLLLISDKKSMIFKSRNWIIDYISHGYKKYIVIITLLLFVYLNPLIGFNSSLLFCYFLIVYFFNYAFQSGFFMALIFLSLCPFLLIVKQDSIAEQSAILAYYFLWIGVLWQIVENVREKEYKVEGIKYKEILSKMQALPILRKDRRKLLTGQNMILMLVGWVVIASFINMVSVIYRIYLAK